VRRKKKAVHKTATTDDKRLQVKPSKNLQKMKVAHTWCVFECVSCIVFVFVFACVCVYFLNIHTQNCIDSLSLVTTVSIFIFLKNCCHIF
jgi:hypothetical protein